MNNLEITVCVLGIAVAQLLTILLTIRRERDIKELRELVNELQEFVDEQRLRIVELRAWLAGRNAAQSSRTESESEPIRAPIVNSIKAPEPTITPKDLPETIQPPVTEDEAGRADSGVSGPSGQAQWPLEDLHRFVARLKEGAPPEPAIPKVPEPPIPREDLPDSIRPSTTGVELERVTRTINWLKDDTDKARGVGAGLPGTSAEKKVG